jgi:predicted transposase YdaD
MSETDEGKFYQQQPYDSTFKAFIDDVTEAMVSFLLKEEIAIVRELKESLFKQNSVKPPLRVDAAYLAQSRTSGQGGRFVLHIEVETAPSPDVEERLLEYASMLHHKHHLPVEQVLLCPFEASNLPTPPYRVKRGEKVRTEHDYVVVALWQEEAQAVVASRQIELYALLPTMKGATSELLIQALRDMRMFFAAEESRLCNHLLWFETLLSRTTMVTAEEKEKVRYVMMNEYRTWLDESYFVQQRMAEGEAKGRAEGRTEGEAKGRAEGEAKGREEGLAEGLQEAVMTAVELRFPSLLDLAQERARRAKTAEALRLVLTGLKKAPNEEVAYHLLNLLAA